MARKPATTPEPGVLPFNQAPTSPARKRRKVKRGGCATPAQRVALDALPGQLGELVRGAQEGGLSVELLSGPWVGHIVALRRTKTQAALVNANAAGRVQVIARQTGGGVSEASPVGFTVSDPYMTGRLLAGLMGAKPKKRVTARK